MCKKVEFVEVILVEMDIMSELDEGGLCELRYLSLIFI